MLRRASVVGWALVLALLLTYIPRASHAEGETSSSSSSSVSSSSSSSSSTGTDASAACGTDGKCSGRGECKLIDGNFTCVEVAVSAGWGTAVLLAAAVVLSVVFVERVYSGCRKMWLKRTGRDGFSRLPVTDVADQSEMAGIHATNGEPDNPAGGDDEWGLPAHTSDEI